MNRAILAGNGTVLTDAVREALVRLGLQVTDADALEQGPPATLLVTVSSPGDAAVPQSLPSSFEAGPARIATLVERFATLTPEPAPDELGELRAASSIIHVIDHPHGAATSDETAFATITDTLVAMTRSSAVRLAPGLRVNAVVPGRPTGHRDTAMEARRMDTPPRLSPDADALLPTLSFLKDAPAVTGQILSLQPKTDKRYGQPPDPDP